LGRTIVSFIIPTCNSERTIANCIRSILSQEIEGAEKEIIVVDDCSEDKTVQIAKGFGAKVIVKERRSGVPESFNIGIKASRGQLIALVDSDVYLIRDWLNAGVAEIKRGSDGVHPTNIAYQPDKIHQKFAKLSLMKGFLLPTFGDASLVRKQVFNKIGLFEGWFAPVGGQDVEIALRAHKAGFKIVHSDEMKFYHDPNPLIRLEDRIKKVVLYQSGRLKAWLMHLDFPPARVGLINDWFWFMMFPLLLVLRKLLVRS
jgi:glycosyltransferase involved in cell wall biosynthesis